MAKILKQWAELSSSQLASNNNLARIAFANHLHFSHMEVQL